MSLRLRDVTNDDLPRIEQWLHADHVRSTWGDPGANLRALKEPPANGNWRAIIVADSHEVGIVLWQHPTREELDVAGLAAGFRQGGLPPGQGIRRRPERAARAHGASPSGRAGRMNQAGPRFWEIFFEVYENLPRQGPGNRACAARALGLCRELREYPAVFDLGCGVGGQTLQLAEEPEMHRRHSDFYAYEFFVARRTLGQSHPQMTEALEQGTPADGLTRAR